MQMTMPWVDIEKPTDPNSEGRAFIGDWVIATEDAEWEPCGATILASQRIAPWAGDGICLARPHHEHPHFCCNIRHMKIVNPRLRIVGVSRRRSTLS